MRSVRICVGAVRDQLRDVVLNLIADHPDLFDRLARGVVDIPVLDGRRDVGAAGAARQRDRPIGVQLHLEIELLRALCGEVDADFQHRPDDLGVHRVGGLLASRLSADVVGPVPLEEGLGHLRTSGVLGADEKDVLHLLFPP